MRNGKNLVGFSLVELLVATIILTIMVALLASVVSGVSSAWGESNGRNERGMRARAIVDFIRSDLTAALLPIDETAQTNLQFVLNPAHLSSEFKNGDALFWQAPIATDRSLGDIAEVGYFVRWTLQNGAPAPVLCRFFVNPSTRDLDGNAVPNPNFLIYANPAAWIDNSLIETVAPGITTGNGPVRYDGLFAENVIAIWFRCLDSQGNAFSREFDSRIDHRLPSSVQVSFALLDPRASQRLDESLQSTLSSLADQIAEEIALGPANNYTVSPAHEFVQRAGGDSSLRPVSAQLKPFTTTIHLSNSK